MGLVARTISKRWPGGCVVFRKLSELSELSPAEITLFEGAMAHWELKADVRFVERTTQDSFITFKPDSAPLDGVSNSSSVGMARGEQFVRIDPITVDSDRIRTARHEVGHALGMFHEHQRRDRGDSIKIKWSKIDGDYKDNFEMVNQNEGQAVGGYDINSIMHYGAARGMSTDGNTALITQDDGTALPPRSNSISSGDIASAAELNRGDAHIYQLTFNGQVEKTLQQSNWTSGWTSISQYTLGFHEFLMFLKKGGGPSSLHGNNLNIDGTVGDRVAKKEITSGYTSLATYGILGTTFAFMYKKSTGLIKVRRILSSGNVTPSSQATDGKLESGWTSASHYAVGWDNFLMFVNANTGGMRTYRVKADGAPGDVLETRTWGTGWTSVKPFTMGASNYLLTLKASNGSTHITRINGDGKVGARLEDRSLGAGWKIAIPYNVAGGTHLFLHNPDSGKTEIRKINGNGKIGDKTDQRRFSKGWTTAAIYTVGAGKYVILVKP